MHGGSGRQRREPIFHLTHLLFFCSSVHLEQRKVWKTGFGWFGTLSVICSLASVLPKKSGAYIFGGVAVGVVFRTVASWFAG